MIFIYNQPTKIIKIRKVQSTVPNISFHWSYAQFDKFLLTHGLFRFLAFVGENGPSEIDDGVIEFDLGLGK